MSGSKVPLQLFDPEVFESMVVTNEEKGEKGKRDQS